MQRFWGRGAGLALPLVWGVAFAAPVSATDEDEAEPPPAAEEEAPLPPLQPPVIQVGEVSVTAARAERAVLDQPGNITILTREDILESGVTTVPELLRREAGVFVTNRSGSNATGVSVEVRGFNNGGGNGSSTLVLVDGRRANLPQTGSADWALIRIDDIDRIEIVRGPVSAVYGDNAVGGVIQIITRRADRDVEAEFITRGGSYSTAQGSAFLGATAGDFTGSLFWNGYTSSGYRDFSRFGTTNAKGRLRYAPTERLIVEAEGGYSTDRRRFPGALFPDEIEIFGPRSSDPDLFESFYDVQDSFVQISAEGVLAEDIVIKFQPSWRRWDQQSATGDIDGLYGCMEQRYSQKSETESTSVNAQLEIDRPMGPFGSRFVAGGDWLYETDRRETLYSSAICGDFPTQGTNRRYIGSGYLQQEFELLQGLFVSGGVRYDYAHYGLNSRTPAGDNTDRDTYGVWSPKAAVTYRVVEPASVYFSYSRGLRFPNFDEIYVFQYPSAPSGAPSLKPEISTAYEFGAKYRSPQVQAGVSLYWMDVEDEIFYNPIAPGGGNRNFDQVRHRGVEVSARYRPFAWVEAYANYTYEDTEIREFRINPEAVGSQMPITPRNRGTVGFNFFLPFRQVDIFEIGVNANLVGPRYVGNDLLNQYPELPSYGTVDLHGRVEKKFQDFLDLAIFFDIRNVTGETYFDQAVYSPFADAVGYYPSPGTNFEIGVSVGVAR